MNNTAPDEPLQVAVSRFEDKVVIHMNQSREYFSMSAAQASTMAESMSRCAYEAHYDKPAPERGAELARQVKAKAVDEVRPKLITRAAHIIRSLTEKGQTPEQIAEKAVDAILREVT